LALRAIDPPTPKFIAVGGLSGTGKTRLARALAPHIAPIPGAVVVRSDVERKALFGAGETAKLPAGAYAPDVTARVYGAIADKARRIVAAGHSAIVDAVFASPQERDALAAAAQAAKVPLQGLFLTADLATRIARVGGRTKDASDADAAVAQAQEDYDLGALEWPKIDASGSVLEILGRARAALSADLRPGQLLD
jgi:predicted kinase